MYRPALAFLAQLSPALAGGQGCQCRLKDLDILAGQHVVYSYPSSSQAPAELLSLTRAGLVGGVILFGVNIDNKTAESMRQLREAYDQSPAPALLKKLTGKDVHFFVTADQEGGKVRRIKDGEPVKSAKEVGADPDPVAAGAAAGEGAAKTLKDRRINVNLAPVVDIFRQAGDFSDSFQRSFGNTSNQVIAAVVPFIKAQQAARVAAKAKHFPGLGAAPEGANTDEQSVTLPVSIDELNTTDMEPYRAAIGAKVDLVMASWAIYPALDNKLPAGLSSAWIKGQLRDQLKFEGVTITDAMEAGSLASLGDPAAVAKMASSAGMDILLASSRNVTQGEIIRKALIDGLQRCELNRTEFDMATLRIAELRSRIAPLD